MFNGIEESLNRMEESLAQDQRKGHRNNDYEHFSKELKKIRNSILNNRDGITEDQRKQLLVRQLIFSYKRTRSGRLWTSSSLCRCCSNQKKRLNTVISKNVYMQNIELSEDN